MMNMNFGMKITNDLRYMIWACLNDSFGVNRCETVI